MTHTIYSRENCIFCDKAKELMTNQGFKFEEKNVYECKEEFKELFPDAKTVPQIIFNGRHIGGYNELVETFENENIFCGGATI